MEENAKNINEEVVDTGVDVYEGDPVPTEETKKPTLLETAVITTCIIGGATLVYKGAKALGKGAVRLGRKLFGKKSKEPEVIEDVEYVEVDTAEVETVEPEVETK